MSDRALRLADRRAREAAQTVFDRPLALIAGAGTGKTSTLVARIIAWCSGPGWERARKQVPDVAGAPICGGSVPLPAEIGAHGLGAEVELEGQP